MLINLRLLPWCCDLYNTSSPSLSSPLTSPGAGAAPGCLCDQGRGIVGTGAGGRDHHHRGTEDPGGPWCHRGTGGTAEGVPCHHQGTEGPAGEGGSRGLGMKEGGQGPGVSGGTHGVWLSREH